MRRSNSLTPEATTTLALLARGRRRLVLGALLPWVGVAIFFELVMRASGRMDLRLALDAALGLGMVIAGTRATRDWRRRWDRIIAADDRVTTLAEVATRPALGAWEVGFLRRYPVSSLPWGSTLPPSRGLVAGALAVAALLFFAPSTAEDPRPIVDPDGSPESTSTVAGIVRPGGRLDATARRTELVEQRDRLRREATARMEAARRLEAHPGTRDLATWLSAGVPPAVGVRRLTPEERRALAGAAADLEAAGLIEASEWLRELPSGEDAPAPELGDLRGEWRAIAAAIERLDGTDGLTASFRDGALAGGGSDRAAGTGSDEGASPAPPGDATGHIDIAGEHRETSDDSARATERASLAGADPDWLALTARPEVETRWLAVVDAYLRGEEEKR